MYQKWVRVGDFRVQGIQGLGSGIWFSGDSGFRVRDLGLGFRVRDLGFLGFRV